MKATINYQLTYKKGINFETTCFCDVDYAANPESRKSVSRYVFIKKGSCNILELAEKINRGHGLGSTGTALAARGRNI